MSSKPLKKGQTVSGNRVTYKFEIPLMPRFPADDCVGLCHDPSDRLIGGLALKDSDTLIGIVTLDHNDRLSRKMFFTPLYDSDFVLCGGYIGDLKISERSKEVVLLPYLAMEW